MTIPDFRAIRLLYGETQLQFGRRLGFIGPDETIARKVRAYEKGERPIVGTMAALLVLLHDQAQRPGVSRRSKLTATEGKVA